MDTFAPNNPRIGEYAVVATLGDGSFATVYHGLNVRTLEPRAIKAVSISKLPNKALRRALQSEVETQQRLVHDNIVRMYGVLRSQRFIFLMLEYCPGGDVQRFIQKHGPVTEWTSQKVLRQLAAGLRHLCENQTVHRDLKLSNLLMSTSNLEDPGCIIKIADFGFARELQESAMAET